MSSFRATPFSGQPPIYVGLYVDDFVYFSESDKVEEWFVNFNNLRSHVKADFMGDVQWFLCQRYDEWSSNNNGKVSHTQNRCIVLSLISCSITAA